ncbi:hypothetical protein B0H12DRAFT_1244403 [Mycena haematopus]|nr:hypothetical protein B0H12DRAFT_1244403 [Mycena haematopus]
MIDTSGNDGLSSPPVPVPTATYRHPNRRVGTSGDSSAEEPTLASSAFPQNVTVRRTRADPRRDVEPIPEDAHILHSPKLPQPSEIRAPSPPHRPGPQIVVVNNSDDADIVTSTPEVNPHPGARGGTRSGGRAKRGGARRRKSGGLPPLGGRRVSSSSSDPDSTRDDSIVGERHARAKEKSDKLQDYASSALSATTLSELHGAFKGLVAYIGQCRGSITNAILDTLTAFESRLEMHHEFPRAGETSQSFSAILTTHLSAPLEIMSAQLQAQHKALQSLSKSVDAAKSPRLQPECTASNTAVSPESVTSKSNRPAPPPLTSRITSWFLN